MLGHYSGIPAVAVLTETVAVSVLYNFQRPAGFQNNSKAFFAFG
jgi:hypothetical protein